MLFTSWNFALFFLIVFLGLNLLRTRIQRQVLILIASIFFYAYWKPIYILVLATPCLIDYWIALRMDAAEGKKRKLWLTVSIVSNLGLLAYFKYADFFIKNIEVLTGTKVPHLEILLPIGISFFTFKTLSYTIDVYRKTIPVCRSLLQYGMFISYFPELIAGPIVRASIFLPQLDRSLQPSWKRTWVGLQMILLGLTKKLVIADQLALLADPVFAQPTHFSPLTVMSGVVAYSIQIYCDFSGYSDMAIGLSHIIGIDLPENFNMPYLARSITEFWRRWHITLSLWLRDYLYIPLGGNRKGRARTYLNLLLTMLLGGLWHGASWSFAFWGLWHGLGLAAHKLWMEWTKGRFKPLYGFGGWFLTYVFVCTGWIFFRSNDFLTAITILRKISGLEQGGVAWFYSPLFLLLPLVLLGHVFGVLVERQSAKNSNPLNVPAPNWLKRIYENAESGFAIRPNPVAGLYLLLPLPGFVGGFVVTAWLLLLFIFAAVKSNPFIYFQF
jgi:alginate O-acetyltransferase complex protein AlgI